MACYADVFLVSCDNPLFMRVLRVKMKEGSHTAVIFAGFFADVTFDGQIVLAVIYRSGTDQVIENWLFQEPVFDAGR